MGGVGGTPNLRSGLFSLEKREKGEGRDKIFKMLKYWRIDGFGEKKARIGGFAYPYSAPSALVVVHI